MKRILFLDLENTLIDTWHDRNIVNNKSIIKNWIHSVKWDEIHVFSYAIWDDEDVFEFKANIAQRLENVFDIKFNNTVLTVYELRIICANYLKIKMDKNDFFDFMKKDIAFRILCEEKFKGCECILLDDMVNDTILTLSNPYTVIQTFDIKKWK